MKLLLDCHIAKSVLPALCRAAPSLEAEPLANWRGGTFLGAGDEDILAACHEEGRVFVTYDLRTIPNLLRFWAAGQRSHSGVIFGDERTVAPSRPGAVARALAALAREIGAGSTVNMIRFLR